MNWLKSLIEKLPLDYISEWLSDLIVWWSYTVKDVPPDELPQYAYVGGSIVVLVLWLFVVRVLPKPLGGISWIGLFAILLTPATALSDSGEIAPASIAVVYSIMLKDYTTAVQSLLPIVMVIIAGLFAGVMYQLICAALAATRIRMLAEEEIDRQNSKGKLKRRRS